MPHVPAVGEKNSNINITDEDADSQMYTSRQIDRQTETDRFTQTDIDVESQINTKTDRQTDRHTHKHTDILTQTDRHVGRIPHSVCASHSVSDLRAGRG